MGREGIPMLYPDFEAVRLTGDRHDDYLVGAERTQLASRQRDATSAPLPGAAGRPVRPTRLDAAWRRIRGYLRPHRPALAHR